MMFEYHGWTFDFGAMYCLAPPDNKKCSIKVLNSCVYYNSGDWFGKAAWHYAGGRYRGQPNPAVPPWPDDRRDSEEVYRIWIGLIFEEKFLKE